MANFLLRCEACSLPSYSRFAETTIWPAPGRIAGREKSSHTAELADHPPDRFRVAPRSEAYPICNEPESTFLCRNLRTSRHSAHPRIARSDSLNSSFHQSGTSSRLPQQHSQCIMRERPVFGMRGRGGSSRKVSERMALYLEGKTPLDANDLSPKEATE
jgi:hypothetical protein